MCPAVAAVSLFSMSSRRGSAVALALAAALAAAGAVPASAANLVLPEPYAGAEAERIHAFDVNLDADSSVERVFVTHASQAVADQNGTYMSVWNRLSARRWERTQVAQMWGPSPGGPGSGLYPPDPVGGSQGLVWVRDLNDDGRVEIAARHFVTASVGESLVIWRQRAAGALEFAPLQRIGGDTLTIENELGNDLVKVFIRAEHSPSNAALNQVWQWWSGPQRWVCTDQCIPGDPNGTSFTGSAAPDTFFGGQGADVASGGTGDDSLLGGAGDDSLRGEAGRDRLFGGPGNDLVRGGSGNDLLEGGQPAPPGKAARAAASSENDRLYGEAGADVVNGGSGADTIVAGSGTDRVNGGSGNDTINSADRRRETVRCGSGRDRVIADVADRLIACERITRR